MAWLFTIICLLGLAATLYAETRHPLQKRFPKMVASTAFIAVALAVGALDSSFGRIMVVGLTLSWFGDLFLTYAGRGPFVAGLVAFLGGHVAYVIAFLNRGTDESLWLFIAAVVAAAVAVGSWLLPTVPKELKGPVIAYIAVISLMVAAAGSTNTLDADWRIPVGATAFYVSDIFVARDRFAAPGLINRYLGLPLYFGGQLLLAWAAGG
ncbi:MAG: lysoplasmalogenase [Acidimicrobiia bacterium]|nr:lysoplasmalogenase [Acidimicrobiia bacterium]